MDDLLLDFVTESKEHLESIEDDFVVLVNNKDNPDFEIVNKVFRAIHTIKGVAGFVGQTRIGELSHIMESLLQQIKVGKKLPEQKYINVLLEGVDQLNEMLDNIEVSNEIDISSIHSKLERLVQEDPNNLDESSINDASTPNDHSEQEELVIDMGDETFATDSDAVEMETASTETVQPFDLNNIPELSITPDMVERFTQESLDLLDEGEQSLLLIDQQPHRKAELIGEAFRMMHSFKGNCGFFGLGDFENLSHKVEAVLDAMRNGIIQDTAPGISLLLKMIDFLRGGLNDYVTSGKSKILGLPGMVDLLTDLITETAPPPAEEETAVEDTEEEPEDETATEEELAGEAIAEEENEIETAISETEATAPPEKEEIKTEPVADEKEEPLPQPPPPKVKITQPVPPKPAQANKNVSAKSTPAPSAQKTPPPKKPGVSAKKPDTSAAAKLSAASSSSSKSSSSTSGSQAAVMRQGIRVDIQKLDALINLVGELVIAEAMVVRNPIVQDLEDEQLERAIHHLNRVSADLQDVAMSVRMIPLASTFKKMTRLVYDVSNRAQKKVNLQLEGEDTEVDKTVIEQIGDPLVHIVRNAIDHGIGRPEERRAAGKPETGTVKIGARHQGGEVWITIQDDGKGLHRDKILAKGIKNGLVLGDGSDLTDSQVFSLIFEPGFSTAEKVTDISGRGVGMDVVKKNIEKLKGRVAVHSKPGEGTTFILHIPLTLAIIDGMLIRVGEACYTIPLLAIRETLRPVMEQITITPDGRENARVREDIIPVLRLHQLYKIKPEFQNLDEGLLVIVESDREQVALFVDELLGQNQTVIKGLSDYLGDARGISGCTILGDGRVSLILDIGGLIRIQNEIEEIEHNRRYKKRSNKNR